MRTRSTIYRRNSGEWGGWVLGINEVSCETRTGSTGAGQDQHQRTFFNTPKRVIICHLICRPTPLPKASAKSILAKERVLLYAVSEIGETRDARRLAERSDLPDLVTAYRLHRAGVALTAERAVSVSAADLYKLASINIRHHWPSEMARKLGLLGASEDPMETRREIETQVKNMRLLALDWRKGGAKLTPPPIPTNVRTLRLAEVDAEGKLVSLQPYFGLRIGERILKKNIHKVTEGLTVWSANVRKPFGYVTEEGRSCQGWRAGARWRSVEHR